MVRRGQHRRKAAAGAPWGGGMEAHALLYFPDGSLKEAEDGGQGRQSSDESR